MRILLIVPTIFSYNIFLKELSQAMLAKGIEVHCACSPNTLWTTSSEQTNGGIRIHPIPLPRGLNLLSHYKSSRQLNDLIKSIKPDLVHAHFSSAIFSAALAHQKTWPVTIGTFQGMSFPLLSGLKGQLLKLAETQSAKWLDGTWVLSDDDLLALKQTVPAAKVHKQVSYGFGCDLAQFDPKLLTDEMRNALLRKLDLNSENYIFAFVGRLVGFKGFDLTVRAFLKVAKRKPNARLLVIGARDEMHPTNLTPEEEEAFQNSPQILKLGWQKEVWQYLGIAHTCVFPSSREGMPVSLMEALAMGVPVITSNSRGCRDVVRNQLDGIVLKDCTVPTLVDAMSLMMDNPSLHKKFSTNAFIDRDRFSRQHYVAEQISIYENLCG